MHDLVILIPAYNEVKNLVKILKYKYNYLIIDDNSNDGTEKILKKKKINYIKNSTKIGYEKSLITGLNYLKKKIDLIICNRKHKNRFLEDLLSLFFQIRFGLKDPLSGMKIYYLPKIKSLVNKIDKNSFLVDVIIMFVNKKYKILNYKIFTKKKIGESKVGYNINVQLKILKLFRFIF
jgi:glycosyltransferase involved in cell wall biosynthesis